MKNLGVQFSIDDFGTCYSNLKNLRKFNARKLKIDRIFINTLGLNEHDVPMVSAIINIAESLGICRNIPKYLLSKIPEYSKIFQNIPKYLKIFKIFKNIAKYSKIFLNILIYFRRL